MPNIIGEEIPQYTIDQINRRQTIHGNGSNSSNQRSTEDLAFLNSQTSWVKLASGVSISEDKLKAMGIVDTTLSGMGLAKKNVLYGGISSLTGDVNNQYLTPQSSNVNISGYEQTNTFGIVPKPGLENVSVKTLNRGSIKKSSIKLKVYNREQFEIIDALYLRLGYTVLLEWGNNKYIDVNGEIQNVGGTLVEDNKRFFNSAFGKNRSYLDLLGPINYYRNKYRGNYDGFLGKISNFSWSFNEDGSYDIDLTVISLGDVIESLKSNISITSNLVNLFKNSELFKQTEEEESNQTSYLTPYDNTNLITAMLWSWKFLNKDNDKSTTKGISIDNGDGIKGFVGRTLDTPSTFKIDTYVVQVYERIPRQEILLYTGKDEIFLSEEKANENINSIAEKLKSGEISPSTYNIPNDTRRLDRFFHSDYRIRFKRQQTEIDEIFQSQFHLPSSVIRLNTPEKDHYIRFEYLLRFLQENVIPYIETPTSTPNTPLFNIDYNRYENFMYSLPNHVSLDPRVCVVRNDSFQTQFTNRQAQAFPELLPFRSSDYSSDPNPNKAYPMNIYLNFKFVVDSLNSNTDERGDVGLFGFISSICTGLNKALGGVNNLEPIIDTTTNTLKIIDSTPIPGVADNKGKYTLEIFGYNNTKSNFIRKVDLKTSITPEYATMVTVGATAGGYVKGTEATAFSNWNKGLTDRFNTELTTQNSNNNPTSSIDEAELNYVEQYLSLYNERYGFLNTNAWEKNKRIQIKFVDDVISSNLSIVTEYYKYLQNKNRAGGAIGFIPFKFNFVMDGLSGFKIYNKLHISTRFLPRNYSDTLDFLITGITHDLNDNDWETSIQTTVIPKTTKVEDLNIDTNLIQESITNVNSARLSTSPTLPSPTSIGEGDKIRVDADLTTPWKHSSIDGEAKGAYRYLQIVTNDPSTGTGKYYTIPGTNCTITSGFGQRNVKSGTHQAVDVASGGGLPQTCPFQKGKIIQQLPNTYGIIKIEELNPTTNNPTGRYARFVHSEYFGFSKGDIVYFNDIVGKEGRAGGNGTTPYAIHSHFELTLKKQGTSTKVTVDNKRAVKYPPATLPDYFIAPTIEEIKCAHGLSASPLPLPEVSNNGGVTNYKCIF